jgi:hypothetical protein
MKVQAQYILTKSTFSTGGGSSSSANYILKAAVGQTVIGEGKSSNYIEQAGFYTYSKHLIGVEEQKIKLPKVFSLSPPYPNPTTREVTIKYGVPWLSKVEIVIYDVTGRVVKELVNEEQKPGFYVIRWNGLSNDGTQVTQGVYFLRMIAPEFKRTKKVILLK